MKGKYPYVNCPIYAVDQFILRLVEERDAEDLLLCYADVSAVRLMNADNCTSNFHYSTIEAMHECIVDWLGAYRQNMYVRFAIIDTQSSKAIGTIEMYDKTKKLGVLRLDLCSAYERQEHIFALLTLSIEHFYAAFGVRQIVTKAIPVAAERISALRAHGFTPAEGRVNGPYGDYYIR